MIKPENIDEYIRAFPKEVQVVLEKVRTTIQKAAPDAKEKISYSMPAFEQNGIIVYFAAFKNHIGLYALPGGHETFQEELSKYKSGKGSVQFPLDQPMPFDLITRIVKFRVKENLEKSKKK
ncbi:iron chaperone [Flavobacterium sp. FlaQc-48]|uniref:iron chaperone n=1 Tax=Flavobacterium sp. FlaQc-48 TaxID=3374181 RepID=UPI003757ECE6